MDLTSKGFRSLKLRGSSRYSSEKAAGFLQSESQRFGRIGDGFASAGGPISRWKCSGIKTYPMILKSSSGRSSSRVCTHRRLNLSESNSRARRYVLRVRK
jgi:hypothetical protein